MLCFAESPISRRSVYSTHVPCDDSITDDSDMSSIE